MKTFERIYFAWLRMGIVTIASETGIYSLRSSVEQWQFIIQSNASRYALLCWIPYVWILFSRANLFHHSSSCLRCSFFFARCCSILQCVLNAFLSIVFSNHSNYAALIHSTKTWNIPPTIPIFCTYIKHRNHFPYKTCILSGTIDVCVLAVRIVRLHSLSHLLIQI